MTTQLRSVGLVLAVLTSTLAWPHPSLAQDAGEIGTGVDSELDELIEETVVVRRRAPQRAPRRTGFPSLFRNASHRLSHMSQGFVPAHARQQRQSIYSVSPNRMQTATRRGRSVLVDEGPEVIAPGQAVPRRGVYESVEGDINLGLVDEGYIDGYAGYPGHPGDCGGCAGGGCLIGCPSLNFDNLELFAGVQGYTGQLNHGGPGSFGFHEGVNWGIPVPCLPGGLGVQLGFLATQSNLSGGGSYTSDRRMQQFATLGVFRRVDWGLQGGLAYDWMNDDWHSTKLGQVRGEFSWMFPCNHEIGFWFTSRGRRDSAVGTENQNPNNVHIHAYSVETIPVYAFFYRWRHDCLPNANGRLSAGFTGNKDGFLAADFEFPITPNFSARAGFAYLIPEIDTASQEAWNVGLSLVWRPKCGDPCSDYFRPLFNVANNGTFFVDQTTIAEQPLN